MTILTLPQTLMPTPTARDEWEPVRRPMPEMSREHARKLIDGRRPRPYQIPAGAPKPVF